MSTLGLTLQVLSILSMLVLLVVSISVISASPKSNELIILHTNDVHGQIDPQLQELAYLKAYKDSVGAHFIFDAGDSSQGLPLNNISQGKRLAQIYNFLEFDAATLGNHEFDYSRNMVLGKNDGFIKEAKFPIVASNIFFGNDALVNEIPNTPVFNTSVVVPKIVNGENVNVGVIGLTTPETKFKADPRNSEGMEFKDPLPTLKSELNKPEHKDTDYTVVLAHLGVDTETKKEWRGDYLAEQIAMDSNLSGRKFIIIDGHSHTDFKNGKVFGANVLYGQTGGKLSTFGEMRIDLNDFEKSSMKTISIRDNYNIHPDMAKLTPNASVISLINDAASEFEKLAGYTVLDNLTFDLNGEREHTRTRETNFGNLIADSMYDYAKSVFGKTDLAVINGGAIRASIKSGKVTYKDILASLPFGNRIVQIDIQGDKLYEMFEHSLKAEIDPVHFDDNGLNKLQSAASLLHVSNGVKLEYDPRLPVGMRVQKLLINGDLVDRSKIYKIATIEFLGVGGDGYSMLGGPREEGANDADVLENYLLKPSLNLNDYMDDIPYRVISKPYFESIAYEDLKSLLLWSQAYNSNKEVYTEMSLNKLVAVQKEVENVLSQLQTTNNKLTSISYEEYVEISDRLVLAIDQLEIVDETLLPDNSEDEIPLVNVEPHADVPTAVLDNVSFYLLLMLMSLLSLHHLFRSKFE